MGRATRPYRTVPATIVAPGDELRPGRRGGSLPHEFAPLVARRRCERILLAFGGAAGPRLAEGDQTGAARLVTRLDHAFGHPQLIHRHLPLLLGVLLPSRSLA